MLPKENRLKKKKDFDNVFKNGRGYKEDFLYLKIIGNDLKNSRFGFVIGKNFSNSAVVRNKMRRRLRELVKINLPSIKKNIDGVIVVRPGLEITDFWELEEKIKNIFKKANIIEN